MLEKLELKVLHPLMVKQHLLLLKELQLVHLLLSHALVEQLFCLSRQVATTRKLLLRREALQLLLVFGVLEQLGDEFLRREADLFGDASELLVVLELVSGDLAELLIEPLLFILKLEIGHLHFFLILSLELPLQK